MDLAEFINTPSPDWLEVEDWKVKRHAEDTGHPFHGNQWTDQGETFYHGSSTRVLERIRKEGLLSSSDQFSSKDLPAKDTRVFLSRSRLLAESYALNHASWEHDAKNTALLLEVHVPADQLSKLAPAPKQAEGQAVVYPTRIPPEWIGRARILRVDSTGTHWDDVEPRTLAAGTTFYAVVLIKNELKTAASGIDHLLSPALDAMQAPLQKILEKRLLDALFAGADATKIPKLRGAEEAGHPFHGNQWTGEFGLPPIKDDPAPGKSYFYHATDVKFLSQIAQEGLKPNDRAMAPISLAPHLESARWWGTNIGRARLDKTALLRVKRGRVRLYPHPEEDDYQQDDETAEDATFRIIPPEDLEVYKDGKWQPLLSFRTALSGEHSFASTQLNLPASIANEILEFGASIPEDDLADDGCETTIHVTVKYGLHDDSPDSLRQVLRGFGPIALRLGPLDIFEADEYDVLYVSVESSDLEELNALISGEVDVTDTHKEYTPHVTIAYLQPGVGQYYVGLDVFEGRMVLADEVVFSDRAGEVTLLRTAESAGHEFHGNQWTAQQRIIETLREKLQPTNDWNDTKFLFPDGTGVGSHVSTHREAAEVAGLKLNDVLLAGVIRVTNGTGIQAMSPITATQAKVIVDGYKAYKANDGDPGLLYVDVSWPGRVQLSDKVSIPGLRADATDFGQHVTDDALRNWINKHFSKTQARAAEEAGHAFHGNQWTNGPLAEKLKASLLKTDDDWFRTKFILPDGSALGAREPTHWEAAFKAGVDLDEVLKEGVVRISEGGGIETAGPINSRQAELIKDGWTLDKQDTHFVDVYYQGPPPEGRSYKTIGQSHDDRTFEGHVTADAIRNFVNKHFEAQVRAAEAAGHPFHGNQWTNNSLTEGAITDKHGKSYRVEWSEPVDPQGHTRTTYTVYDGDKSVGKVELNKKLDGVIDVVVDPAYRRQGLATALYDYIENDLNTTLKANPIQTPEGKAFRDKRLRTAGDIEGHPFHGNQWTDNPPLVDVKDVPKFDAQGHYPLYHFTYPEAVQSLFKLSGVGTGDAYDPSSGYATLKPEGFSSWTRDPNYQISHVAQVRLTVNDKQHLGVPTEARVAPLAADIQGDTIVPGTFEHEEVVPGIVPLEKITEIRVSHEVASNWAKLPDLYRGYATDLRAKAERETKPHRQEATLKAADHYERDAAFYDKLLLDPRLKVGLTIRESPYRHSDKARFLEEAGHPFHGNQYTDIGIEAKKHLKELGDPLQEALVHVVHQAHVAEIQGIKLTPTSIGTNGFYHGTASSALASIKEKGLVPSGGPGGDYWALKNEMFGIASSHIGERAQSVYLGRDYRSATQFAKLAAEINHAQPVILKVQIPANEFKKLRVDENFSLSSQPDALRFVGTIRPEWIKGVNDNPEHPLTFRPLAEGDVTFYVVFFVKDPLRAAGDVEGHPFHGNQYTEGLTPRVQIEGRAAIDPAIIEKAQVMERTLARLDFPLNKASIKFYERGFNIGGKGFTEGGHFSPGLGEIVINGSGLSNITSLQLQGMIAHEVSHRDFNDVKNALGLEGGGAPGIQGLTEESTLAAKVHELILERGDQLEKEDGVSAYTRAYWRDVPRPADIVKADVNDYGYAKDRPYVDKSTGEMITEAERKARIDAAEDKMDDFDEKYLTAVNETLADIARIDDARAMGHPPGDRLSSVVRWGDNDPTPLWRELATNVKALAKELRERETTKHKEFLEREKQRTEMEIMRKKREGQ